jgi:hypothetical protein
VIVAALGDWDEPLLATATPVQDFKILDGYTFWFSMVTWSPGEMGIKPFYVPLVDDLVIEPDETIVVRMTVDNNVIDSCPFGICEAILTIIDNDATPPVDDGGGDGGGGGGCTVSTEANIDPTWLFVILILSIMYLRNYAGLSRSSRRKAA